MSFNTQIIISLVLLFLTSSKTLTLDKTSVENLAYYDPGETIDKLSVSMTNEFYTKSIDYLSKVIDRYVFLDVLKKPPQPKGMEEPYHNTVDLIAELKKINITNTNFYAFYREVRRVLDLPRDGHFRIRFNHSKELPYIFGNLEYFLPFKFTIDQNKNVYAKLATDLIITKETLIKMYGEKLVEDILSHENSPINNVNGENPINYIQNFRDEFNDFHNKHARFTYNLNTMNKGKLQRFPLSKEILVNGVKISYKNGDSVLCGFKIIDVNNIAEILSSKYDFNIDSILTYFKKYEKNFPFLSTLDAAESFLYENKLEKKTNNNPIKWDYEITFLQCRVDNDKKVNVYHQTAFMEPHFEHFYKFLEDCNALFDKNDYPIVVIQDQNGGGSEEMTYSFQEITQPRLEIMNYNSFRINDELMKNLDIINPEDGKPFAARYKNPQTCEEFKNGEEVFKERTVDDYGAVNGSHVIHYRTKECILTVGKEFRRRIDKMKSNIKKKRTPTEVIVFTDSFSYSATSFYIKALQEFGGAIIVGYNGNPNLPDSTFDAAHSPAGYLDIQIKDPFTTNLTSLGYDVNAITTFESFDSTIQDKNRIHYPREFDVMVVDERVNIYSKYNDNIYDLFIDKANEIFNKYKTKCNPNNKRLLLDSKNCDAKIQLEHAHGGFVCEDGTWSTQCVPYYCDTGYYFNNFYKRCDKNPCHFEY